METNEEIYVKVFLIEDYKNKEKIFQSSTYMAVGNFKYIYSGF
jgi:hypothetical protein